MVKKRKCWPVGIHEDMRLLFFFNITKFTQGFCQTKKFTPKKCIKLLLNKSFHYIFPKPNCSATPFPPYIAQTYLLFSELPFIYLTLPTKLIKKGKNPDIKRCLWCWWHLQSLDMEESRCVEEAKYGSESCDSDRSDSYISGSDCHSYRSDSYSRDSDSDIYDSYSDLYEYMRTCRSLCVWKGAQHRKKEITTEAANARMSISF